VNHPDLNDVRMLRCVTCGRPSKEGLCRLCWAPKRHAFQPEDEQEGPRQRNWWRQARNGIHHCTCASCVSGRTKPARAPQGAGRPDLRRRQGDEPNGMLVDLRRAR
jgi:hypothetical protein